MKLKTLAPAILAVVLGMVAAVLVRNSMMKKPAQATVITQKMVPALIATSDLMAGQEITADNVAVTNVPSKNPSDTADLVGNPSEAVGRALTAPVVKGETIHQTALAPRGAPKTLISLVPAGMRAITINVDEGNTFSGMLLPGCYVDVIASVASGKDSLNRTLMSNILVQAVGQRLTSAAPADGKEAPPFHTATLIVTLRQAQMIDLATQNARLRLVLRPLTHSPGDEAQGIDTVTIKQILGDDSSSAVASSIPMTPSAATQPSQVEDPEAPTQFSTPPVAEAGSNHRDVTLILGTQSSHVSVQMPDAPTQSADTINEQKQLIDGAEPPQQ